MATQRVDPYKGFRFRVEIQGIQQAGFTECTGLGSHVEVVEYREGGDMASVRKLIGKTSYPDLTLKWGVTDSTELHDWHITAISGQLHRKNGSVVHLRRYRNRKGPLEFLLRGPASGMAPASTPRGTTSQSRR